MITVGAYDIALSKDNKIELIKEKDFVYDGTLELTTPSKVADALIHLFDIPSKLEERLYAIPLNNSGNILGAFELSHGSASASMNNISGLGKRLLLMPHCRAFLLAHNHPSNKTEPSQNDIRVTAEVQKMAACLDIPMVDHIILTPSGFYYSFKEEGAL